MSVRLRLNLLVTGIFLVVAALAATHVLRNVRGAVAGEMHSSVALAARRLAILVDRLPPGNAAVDLPRLAAELRQNGAMRHLDITLVENGRARDTLSVPATAAGAAAPAWFAALVHPENLELQRMVALPGGQRSLMVRANPNAEIANAWIETRAMVAALLVLCVVTIGFIHLIMGRFLRPLAVVAKALQGIEQGDLSRRLKLTGLREVDVIVERFNHMASGLEDVRRENRVLAQRSLAIAEDERRRLARELHDEMGQSISAIKALAVSIGARLETTDERVRSSAATIADVSTEVYARVRQMMTRLRPVILDELGLVSALEHMVADWNDHHEGTFCHFAVDGPIPDLPGEVSINLYRIAQEALTNIAKHARASEAAVTLSRRRRATGGREVDVVVIEITDDGTGFDLEQTPRGLGLVGMRERSEAINADLRVDAQPARGVRISVLAPMPAMPPV